MSSFGNRFRTDNAVIWPLIPGSESGYGDDYGAPIHPIPVCQFSDDKVKRDQNGAEFVPRMAFDMGYKPKFGDMIKVLEDGETPSATPEDAQTIRAIKSGTELRGAKDYLVYTG